MKKNKIIVTSILALCAITTIALYCIQEIDYRSHYNTYHAIDKFVGEIRTAKNNDECYANYNSIFKNRKKSSDKKKFLPPVVLSPEMYDKVFTACTQYKNDLAAIKVPENISTDKQVLLKKYLVSAPSVIDAMLDNLNRLNKCKGDTVCLKTGKKFLDKKYAPFRITILEGNLAAIQAQKRFSFRYYFKLRPMEKDLKQRIEDEQTKNNSPFPPNPRSKQTINMLPF